MTVTNYSMANYEIPLYQQISADENKERTDTLISNAIDEYTWDWSFLQEPLQNAIDSFIDPETFTPYKPKAGVCAVSIDINLERDLIIISDNGRGIGKPGFSLIKTPQSTSKRPEKFKGNYDYMRSIKGFAGIGLKSTLYQSNRFSIESIYEGTLRKMKIEDGFDFRNLPANHHFEVKESKVESENGTRVTIGFPNFEEDGGTISATKKLLNHMVDTWMSSLNSKIKPKGNSFSYANKTPNGILNAGIHIIQWYLLTQTYAGCITRTLGDLAKYCQDVHLCIKIIGAYEYKNVKFRKESNHEFLAKYWDPALVLGKKLPGSHKNSALLKQRLPVPYKNIEDVFTAKAKHGHFYRIIERKEGVKKFLKAGGSKNSNAESFVDDFVNGIILYIAKAEAIRRDLRLPSNPGLGPVTKRLSVCGVPTKHVFDFDIPGYPAVHLVVDINAKVTASKSSFTGAFRGKTGKMLEANGLNEFTKELQRIIYSKLVQKGTSKVTGGGGGGGGGGGVIDQDDEHKPESPDNVLEEEILLDLFDRKTKIIQEQDVIQAFVYYCANNSIPIGWESIHQKAEYDSWISHEEWVKIAKNPQKEDGYAVIEFKRDFTSILEDTNSGLGQLMEDIDIIICNDDPMDKSLTEEPYKSYTFVSLDDDQKGIKAGFYPKLEGDKLQKLYPIRAWKGNPAKKSKVIQNGKKYCLIISMKRIYDSESHKYEEE
jgi:hypothetical protein